MIENQLPHSHIQTYLSALFEMLSDRQSQVFHGVQGFKTGLGYLHLALRVRHMRSFTNEKNGYEFFCCFDRLFIFKNCYLQFLSSLSFSFNVLLSFVVGKKHFSGKLMARDSEYGDFSDEILVITPCYEFVIHWSVSNIPIRHDWLLLS